MTSRNLRLGRIFGIELRIDYSWFIIFVLVTWSLASYYFPMAHAGWSTATYWLLGIVTSLLYFGSVVAHELAHSFVSQAYGVPVPDITLFIFGGVSEISEEPKSARAEFLMALAGPASSLLIAGIFGLLSLITTQANPQLHALAGWLSLINVALGLFNLIPGFPLDGGRVFRAIVWGITGNLHRATAIASGLGSLVAYGFIAYGIWQVFGGNWANGVWIAFIGWFLLNAATSSYRQLTLSEAVAGHTARDVMVTECRPVSRDLTLDVLVDQVILPSGGRCFPVIEGGQFYGLVSLQNINKVPRERWPTAHAAEVMTPRAELKTVKPDEELSTVIQALADERVNQLPVMDDGHLVGMVARDNLVAFVRTLIEQDRARGSGRQQQK